MDAALQQCLNAMDKNKAVVDQHLQEADERARQVGEENIRLKNELNRLKAMQGVGVPQTSEFKLNSSSFDPSKTIKPGTPTYDYLVKNPMTSAPFSPSFDPSKTIMPGTPTYDYLVKNPMTSTPFSQPTFRPPPSTSVPIPSFNSFNPRAMTGGQRRKRTRSRRRKRSKRRSRRTRLYG